MLCINILTVMKTRILYFNKFILLEYNIKLYCFLFGLVFMHTICTSFAYSSSYSYYEKIKSHTDLCITSNLYQKNIIEKENKDTVDIYENIWQKPTTTQLFEIFLTSQEKLINNPMIAFSIGISQNKLPFSMQLESLGTTNSFSLEYGFTRLDSVEKKPKILEYSSEYAFIELNTNKFEVLNKSKKKLYDNEFGFGVGMRTGLGYSTSGNLNFYLLHSSAFLWTYFDYANYDSLSNLSNKAERFFDRFDDEYKFGWKGAATISTQISKNLYIDISYEHNNIFSGFEFVTWSKSWILDNILQRWIDLLDPIFIEELKYSYPIFKFVYKNAISIVLSEFRHRRQYYPFKSDFSLLQRKGILHFRLIF